MLPVPRCFDHITGTLVSWPCYLCTGILTMLPVPRYFDHANGTRVSWPCYQYLGFLTMLPVLRYHDHVTGIKVSWPFYWYSGILTNDHAFHPAREWVSSATVMWMVKELIENNAAHSDLTQVDQLQLTLTLLMQINCVSLWPYSCRSTGSHSDLTQVDQLRLTLTHRLISRDRPTKTGSLCLCRPFFYVAALSMHNAHTVWRVVDGGWDGTNSVK